MSPDKIAELRAKFEALNMSGGVALVDGLSVSSSDLILKIGSSTVGQLWLDQSKYDSEAKFALAILFLPSVYFGSHDGKVTPLEDLRNLIIGMEAAGATSEVLVKVDMFLADLASVLATKKLDECKAIGSASIFKASGVTMVQ